MVQGGAAVSRIPVWLPVVVLLCVAINWAACVAFGILFGAHIGVLLFILIEVRAVLAFAMGRAKESRDPLFR